MNRQLAYETLQNEIRYCEKCFWRSKKRILFGHGSIEDPKVMLVGSGPSLYRTGPGKVFGASSWDIYQKTLKILELGDGDYFTTNLSKCAVPYELVGFTQHCLDFFFRELKIVNPEFVVLFGRKTSLAVLGIAGALKLKKCKGKTCITMTHPANVAYHPERSDTYFEQVKELKRFLTRPTLFDFVQSDD